MEYCCVLTNLFHHAIHAVYACASYSLPMAFAGHQFTATQPSKNCCCTCVVHAQNKQRWENVPGKMPWLYVANQQTTGSTAYKAALLLI